MLTAADLLRSVADDIERQGHFKSGTDVLAYEQEDNPDGPCCLILNPTTRHVRALRYRMRELLPEAQLLLAPFSDATPTDELLALLRRRADELEGE